MNLQKICKQCNAHFEITDADILAYEKLSPVFQGQKYLIPPPTLCPPCRKQRRCVQRNDRNLYQRKCDKTGQTMISCYSPDKPFTVYNRKDWLEVDNTEFGRDYDFSRPFFEQFFDLQKVTIKQNVIQSGVMENSEFNNFVGRLKNSYMCFDAGQGEEILYCNETGWLKSSVDNTSTSFSELCYECVHVQNAYNLLYSKYCNNCSDSAFLEFCNGCKHCIGCINLRNQEYCVFNQKVSKEQYEEVWNDIFQGTNIAVNGFSQRAHEFFQTQPHRALCNTDAHDSTGDVLILCENMKNCFNCFESKDCAFCDDIYPGTQYFYDVTGWGFHSDFSYECIGVGSADHEAASNQCRFSCLCFYGAYDVNYSNYCFQNCQNLFGCSQLRKKQYCILNKQYTKEEYEIMVPKIIEHMIGTGEWGEFFPAWISQFAYNETWAMEYFPLTREQVLQQGYVWKEKDPAQFRTPTAEIPSFSSLEIDESFTKELLACEHCKRNYKIMSSELAFYKKMKLPIPACCPECRYQKRLSQRNPRKLWNRECVKCTENTQTSYSPDRAERIYCEKCYLESIY